MESHTEPQREKQRFFRSFPFRASVALCETADPGLAHRFPETGITPALHPGSPELVLKGSVHAVPIPDTALAAIARTEVADSVLAIVGRSSFDPALNGLATAEAAAALRASVSEASTNGEAAASINAFLLRLGSSHAGLGPDIRVTREALAENGTPRAGISPPAAPVSWRKLANGIGYLKLSSFPGGAHSVPARAALDRAFSALNASPALVIDLRGNPGGHLEVAAWLASHLSSRTFDVGVFASQSGLRRYSVANARDLDFARLPRLAAASVNSVSFFPRLEELEGAAMLTAGGGGVSPYCGRVFVLIDGGSASTAEVVAGGIQGARLGTLVGTRTAGALLASAPFTPARGWVLRLPVYDYRTAAGARVEGVGIEPDEVIRPRGRYDAALERAVALAQDATHRVPACTRR